MYHRCDNEPDLSYNGYHLMMLCKKLLYLQSLDFIIQVQLFEKPNMQTLTNCIITFRTPFWLDGPMGCKRVCVVPHQVYCIVQMFSLPYTLADVIQLHTIDILDTQFNICKENEKISFNLPAELQALWYKMNNLYIILTDKQKVTSSFLQALQCPFSHGKILTLIRKGATMYDNDRNHVQLTQFSILELANPIDNNANSTYNLQGIVSQVSSFINKDVCTNDIKDFL